MAIPATINEDIQDGLSRSISHRSLNNSLILSYTKTDEKIKVPINSIISKYYNYFLPYIDEVELTEQEQRDYRYSPKKFSEDMYKTTGYWSIILYINECHSIIDFEPKTIKYIDPAYIEDILSEIMILEDIDQ